MVQIQLLFRLIMDNFIKIKREEVLTFNFYKDNLVHEY